MFGVVGVNAMPVVYADVVWLVNFVMDGVLLLVTVWVVKRPFVWWRILAGALIGAMYSMLLFLPPLSALTTWPGKAGASLFMVWAAVPCRSWLDLARSSALYYFVSFVFAGAVLALHFAVPGVSVAKGTVIHGDHLAYGTSIGSLALVVAIPVAGFSLKYAFERVRRVKQLTSSLHQAHVVFQGQSVSFVGLVDTGNQLRHPISGKPVCFVELAVLEPLLPPSLCSALREGVPVYDVLDRLDVSLVGRFTTVPFRSAGGSQHFILGFRPDQFLVECREGPTVRTVASTCVVGIHVDPLSVDHRFQGILHLDVMTGDDQIEQVEPAKTQRKIAHSPPTMVDENPSDTVWRQ